VRSRERCAIPGTPTAGRGAQLAREVLELSLRTLAKLHSIDSTLIFIPSGSTKEVVYLTRGDLTRQLGESLSSALAQPQLPRFISAAHLRRPRHQPASGRIGIPGGSSSRLTRAKARLDELALYRAPCGSSGCAC
jgi:hypothetical protein